MSAPRFVDCQCKHNKLSHEVEGAPRCCHDDCPCPRYVPDVKHSVPTKVCTSCAKTLPVTEFYLHNKSKGKKRCPRCRDCDNARVRARSWARTIRVRARHRATAELISIHGVEFGKLLEEAVVVVKAEAAMISQENVRLRPGPRREGEQVIDRIDVGRCPDCIGYHDRGHTCQACGSLPEHTHEIEEKAG